MTIAEAIYLLCALTSLLAAALLLRHYRLTRTKLLLWSCVGFFGLAANNILVYVDLVVVQSIDLALLQSVAGAIAMATLLYGLVWETRE